MSQQGTKSATPDNLHFQKYYNTIDFYSTTARIPSNCAQITFYNVGTTNLTINKFPLAPGQGLAFSGNSGEMDVTIYQVIFTGGTGLLAVLTKNYTG